MSCRSIRTSTQAWATEVSPNRKQWIARSGMLRSATALCAALAASPACADSEENLAKTSQNPIGDMISLPFELNVMSGVGPSESTADVLNIKPVYPVRIGKLNLINRFIVPMIYAEGQNVSLPAVRYNCAMAVPPVWEIPPIRRSSWQAASRLSPGRLLEY